MWSAFLALLISQAVDLDGRILPAGCELVWNSTDSGRVLVAVDLAALDGDVQVSLWAGTPGARRLVAGLCAYPSTSARCFESREIEAGPSPALEIRNPGPAAVALGGWFALEPAGRLDRSRVGLAYLARRALENRWWLVGLGFLAAFAALVRPRLRPSPPFLEI